MTIAVYWDLKQQNKQNVDADIYRAARGLNFVQSLHLHPYFVLASS